MVLESRQRSKEAAGQASLVRVPEELGVEVLVPGKGQVLALSNLVKCFVQNVDLHRNSLIIMDWMKEHLRNRVTSDKVASSLTGWWYVSHH